MFVAVKLDQSSVSRHQFGCCFQLSELQRQGDSSEVDPIIPQFLFHGLSRAQLHVLLRLPVVRRPADQPRTIGRAGDVNAEKIISICSLRFHSAEISYFHLYTATALMCALVGCIL